MLPEFTFKGAPMTKEQTKQVLGLMMAKSKEKPAAEDEQLSPLFLSQVILTRISAYKLPFTVSNFFLLASMICGIDSPGKMMLLLALCFQYHQKNKKTLLTLNDWANMFPWGMPTKEEFHQMWDSQKREGEPLGNMVDNPEYWK
jgi:hypothetical protein